MQPPKPDFCEKCQKFTHRFKYLNWTIWHEVLADHWHGNRGGVQFSGPNPDVVKSQIDQHLIRMEEIRPTVAHRCSNGDKIRPYGTFVCSMCLPNGSSENLSAYDLTNLLNSSEFFQQKLLKAIKITQDLFGDKSVGFDSWCDPSTPEIVMLKCIVHTTKDLDKDLKLRMQWHRDMDSLFQNPNQMSLEIIPE